MILLINRRKGGEPHPEGRDAGTSAFMFSKDGKSTYNLYTQFLQAKGAVVLGRVLS